MPRYVILEHDHPVLHWDFMLEVGEVLRTWRLEQPPRPGQVIPAEPLVDHRRAYLDYEGPVSGGRGSVQQWDSGLYTWEEKGPNLTLNLEGKRLYGRAFLGPDEQGHWFFRLERPEGGWRSEASG